jgi:signal transduction histidine kinase
MSKEQGDLMDLALLFETMLGLTSLSALWTGLWLWWHARFQPVLKPLAGFCAMMAAWCGGHLALQHDLLLPGKVLILANPLMPAFFLQFALRYVTTQPQQPQLRWIEWLRQYQAWVLLGSVLVVLLSWSQPSARVQALYGMPVFFLFDGFGWFNLGYTVLLGILAHWVLWRGRHAYQGNKRHSIVAISMTAGIGLLLATSFVFPSIGLNWYPWPMLVLPLYLVLLVYSVVRYQLLAVNAFASRALVYLVMGLLLLLLMALISSLFGQFGMPALAAVPGWQLWLYSSLLLLFAAAAYRPASRLAERLIFPGVQLSEAMVSRWQQQLASAADWQQLAEQAALLIRQPLKQPVQIGLLQGTELLAQSTESSALKLQVTAVKSDDSINNNWQFSIEGEQGLTPTLKLTAEVFGSLLVSSCARLQSALALAEAEKQQLAQQHLVELGALAAAMAHELRNPLNIISMASAAVDAELRGHIQTQLKRADRLIADMLVYAGRLQLQPALFELGPLVQSLLQQAPDGVRTELEIPAGLQLQADPYRIQQVLQNLFDNAFAFLRNQPGACLRVEAGMSGNEVQIRVLNNGPALDPSLLDGQLFRPFVSKRAGGSGLGLAIVARIIEAHQGRIQHQSDPDWPVCFVLHLPAISGEIR